MFIGGAEVAAAVSVPSPLSVPTAIVGAGNVAYGFSDVFEGISVLTGNGSINFGRDLLFDGDQKKWDAAGAVLDISGFALTGASTGWGKAAKAGMASAPEVLRSIATQLGKMYLSASAGSVAGSYVEGAVTSVAGEDWGRGAGLITRFGVGGATYGGLSYADQRLNISGIYRVEAFDPAALEANRNLNFSTTSAEHMSDPNRYVPVQILQEAIRTGTPMPDPRGGSSTMYYTTMMRGSKSYNLEVLYDAPSNTIYHFKYTEKAIGNLPATK